MCKLTDIDKSLFDNIEGIFFDMDGTLLDSMWLWKAIDIEYLNMHGAEYEEGLQENIAGMSFHQTAQYFKEHFGIKDPIEKMKDDWNRMAMDKYKFEVTLKKGAKEFLDILNSFSDNINKVTIYLAICLFNFSICNLNV